MKLPQTSRPAALSLAAAALLTGFAIARLPPPEVWFHAPETPFDRTDAWAIRSSYLLLKRAAAIVPPGASVLMRTEPPDPVADTSLFRDAVALLPGRRVLPAALWDRSVLELERQAEYLVLLGPRPSSRPGRLLLETTGGSVWQRTP